MKTGRPEKRELNLRLLHDGAQPGAPLDEPLQFGLQDSRGDVHAGTVTRDGLRQFNLTVEVKGTEAAGQPVFAGTFAHGPPAGRFLYLSWKRVGTHAAPWAWRIKIPFAGIDWTEVRSASGPDACLEANVVGRRPHASGAIDWRLGTYGILEFQTLPRAALPPDHLIG